MLFAWVLVKQYQNGFADRKFKHLRKSLWIKKKKKRCLPNVINVNINVDILIKVGKSQMKVTSCHPVVGNQSKHKLMNTNAASSFYND